MTTDNKTLADAQPGGRVRLGDGRALIQRYDAAGAKFRESLMDDRYSDAQRVELRRELTAVQDELLTALSAHPSPGGQGDSRSEKAATFLRQYLTYLRSSPRQGLRPRWCDVYEALEVAIEALAARQPVEVSEGGFRAAASRQTASAESNATAEALIAAARHPSKQPDSVALGEATEFCIENGDRQPVGESVWVEVRREGDRTFPRAMTRGQADAFLRSCNVGPLPTIHSLYAAPTAQAVDLDLQLDRYDAGLLGDGGGGDVGWWQDYIRAELDRAHEFYQDQADSQAVGNG
ncbi:hypothetical protein NJG17_10680 [Stenotrophomonas maltophilia]|uniref:hypothetical protein n=1 Tax=Stenotrophomonas maltophilia TaxID=40324 RepID=UPI00209B48A5|nr:hypothetical protein [Stenotrophomonas maltophilia]MCO7500362.1 hypothetical protein [Stenotrophomonas maltophilia]